MKISVIILSICALATGKVVPTLDGRIIGGVETTIEEFPFQVSVRYYGEHWCGGTILDENTILTSCRCVSLWDRKKFSVRVGNTIHFEGEEHVVSDIIEHEEYGQLAAYNNDVALLKLATPLTFNERVQPIELQPQDDEISAGIDAVVSGWGRTSADDAKTSDILRKVSVRLITFDECKKAYISSFFGVTKNMVCAQSPMHDFCQGDDGGPLVANGKLIGVISWNLGCARPQYPGVYAKVSSLNQWIVEHK